MAYFTPNSRGEQGDFEYPPVPDAYTDQYSNFDAHKESQAGVPNHLTGTHPNFYPFHDHQAMASSTATPHHFSYPAPELRVPALRQLAPAPSPASSSEHRYTASPAFMDHTFSSTGTAKTKFVSYSAEDRYKKRPRGTTGRVVCDKCGSKFTVISSLNRHNRICRGKKPAKRSTSTQRSKIARTKDATLRADHNDQDLRATEPSSIPPQEQGQVLTHDSNIPTVPAASMVVNPSSAENPSLISDPTTINSCLRKPISAQPYVLRGRDISSISPNFFCDLCPEVFARRDMLQVHKSRIHGSKELPHLPESGTIDRPMYLTGVTLENATKHSLMALKIWEGGGLSSSPCQPCISKGLDCIVNPLVSSNCSYCNHRGNGSYCGAASIKYFKPIGIRNPE